MRNITILAALIGVMATAAVARTWTETIFIDGRMIVCTYTQVGSNIFRNCY